MTESAVVSAAISDWVEAGKPAPTVEVVASVALEAMRRVGLRPADLDAVISTTSAMPFGHPTFLTTPAQHMGHRLAGKMGSNGLQVFNVSGACASAAAAFSIADSMIKSGKAKKVLVVGYDNSPRGFYFSFNSYLDTDMTIGYPLKVVGAVNPSYWAMWARRRAYEMGKPVEDIKELMAIIKEELSKNGALNPHARYKRVFTVKEVMESPIVDDPLHLYMISAVSSGAGAVLLADMDTARRLTDKPVKVAASAVGGPLHNEPSPRLTYFTTAGGRRAGKPFYEWRRPIEDAYRQAGMGAEDLDFAEVHDTSAFHVINWIDQIMGWEREETDRLIRGREFGRGGKFPINASGGTTSFGEAVYAQALMEVYEIFTQLRGEAGERQIRKEIKVGMATAYGAYGSYGAIILERAW